MTEAARLVDELTTLLYEPCLGKCLTHGPDCRIVVCGACRRKADKPESVVHDSDCPVYHLIRAEEVNTAVIRANAEEIADLEDKRDELEAKVNALTVERDAALARAEAADGRVAVMAGALRDVLSLMHDARHTGGEAECQRETCRIGAELVSAALAAATPAPR